MPLQIVRVEVNLFSSRLSSWLFLLRVVPKMLWRESCAAALVHQNMQTMLLKDLEVPQVSCWRKEKTEWILGVSQWKNLSDHHAEQWAARQWRVSDGQDHTRTRIFLAFFLNGTSIQNWDELVIVFHQRFFFSFQLVHSEQVSFRCCLLLHVCMCLWCVGKHIFTHLSYWLVSLQIPNID